ncbi:glycosyl hydrolase family 18 protein [Nocardioides sp. SYSU D00038]|uniref:glycosyl hydrolase family 18 protein n=1 Tax=Nocardioides sp. SYSU D00038 TaxID=2812554 RepID=UPI0019684580|nr:glycosyl hydrolase family 18 protein [Nocardioides sp. SYSU D00038]
MRTLLAGLLGLSLLVAAPGPAAAERPGSSVWIPYWETPGAVTEVVRNGDVFAEASLFWYDADCRRLHASTGAGDRGAVRRLRDAGLRPFVTVRAGGLPPRAAVRCLGDRGRRAAHVRMLVRLATSRGYAGLDLDYEQLALTTDRALGRRVRAAFTALVSDLCPALRAVGRDCSVTVMPRWHERPVVWRGVLLPWVYDYEALGASVDRLRVMAYDQHAGKGAGPVAGLPWVRRVARFAAARVPGERVQLGVPTYGRDFTRRGSRSLVGAEALRLARRHGVRPRWDARQAELTFRYRTRGTWHRVWSSSPRSVAVRSRLARELGLAGAAYWAAGLTAPGTWAAVRRRLR